MHIDPDRICHKEALDKLYRLIRGEKRWLDTLEEDVANGYTSFTKDLETQRGVVASLQRMYDSSAEQRMLATTRWVYNSKFPNSPSLMPPDESVPVRAAIDAGKTVRTAHQPMKDKSSLDVRTIEFTDPTDPNGGKRWAVWVEWPEEHCIDVTISDHPTRFDADTRFEALLTIAKSLE